MSGHTAPDAPQYAPGATGQGHVEGRVFPLPGSKSLSARGLMLAALWADRGHTVPLPGLSDSEDTQHLARALAQAQALPLTPPHPRGGAEATLDTGEGGTGMRFLAARLALTVDEPLRLTGQGRINERPIGPLAEALGQLGAQIDYLGRHGSPPLRIHPRQGRGPAYDEAAGVYRVTLRPQVSSQFASALMMAAPLLGAPLELILSDQQLSAPYLSMTAALMRRAGWTLTEPAPHHYLIDPQPAGPPPAALPIEADWSAASYAYALAGVSGVPTRLPGLTPPTESLQGDASIAQLMACLGVTTTPTHEGLLLTPVTADTHNKVRSGEVLTIDFAPCPDIAQTVIVYASLLGIGLRAIGLETLYHKETDRVAALATELARLGRPIEVGGGVEGGAARWVCVPDRAGERWHPSELPPPLRPLEAHGDHRMAMSLAPALYLAARAGVRLPMSGAATVGKSFPGFWEACRGLLGGTYWPG